MSPERSVTYLSERTLSDGMELADFAVPSTTALGTRCGFRYFPTLLPALCLGPLVWCPCAIDVDLLVIPDLDDLRPYCRWAQTVLHKHAATAGSFAAVFDGRQNVIDV